MVLVEIDGNYIDGEPMKDRTEGSSIKAYLILGERITASKSVRPKTHVLSIAEMIKLSSGVRCLSVCKEFLR